MTQAPVMSVYDRFTELAKRALVAARDAAASLGHDFIGTEHVLLGLAQTAGAASEALRTHGIELGELRAQVVRHLEEHGVTATRGQAAKDALSTLGIDVGEIQRRADDAFGAGALKFPRPAYSVHAKKAIQASLQQAVELGRQQMDTGDLLLGLLADDQSTAVQVLAAMSVDAEALRLTARERMPG